jgi:hypothetical protein
VFLFAILVGNKINMILTDLTKAGYLLLKKDRSELVSQIKELQDLLDDIDFAYPFLESLFEPKINLLEEDGKYYGSIDIIYPTAPAPVQIKFEIGSIADYANGNESKLQEDLDNLAIQKLKEKFPLHFS